MLCKKSTVVIVHSAVHFCVLMSLLVMIDLILQPNTETKDLTDTLVGALFITGLSLIPYFYQRAACSIRLDRRRNPLYYLKQSACRSGGFRVSFLLLSLLFGLFAVIALVEYAVSFEYENLSAFLGLMMIVGMFGFPYYNHCRIQEPTMATEEENIKTKQPMGLFGKRLRNTAKCPNCGSSKIKKRDDHYVCEYCHSTLEIMEQ